MDSNSNLLKLIAQRHDLFVDYVKNLKEVYRDLYEIFEEKDCGRLLNILQHAEKTVEGYQSILYPESDKLEGMKQLSEVTTLSQAYMHQALEEMKQFYLGKSSFAGYDKLAAMQKLKEEFAKTIPHMSSQEMQR